jgi:serine-type D-Ala-D-Ala carboxypeptidase (penicillin-binding protein 5/6)
MMNPLSSPISRTTALSVSSLFIAAFILAYVIGSTKPIIPQVAAVATTTTQPSESPFADIELVAKSAYVYRADTGEVLYAKDAEMPLALASLTKVMTALVAADFAPASTVITITPESLREESDSGLLVGERWSLTDLLSFSLVTSSNDGMAAVSEALGIAQTESGDRRATFISLMNAKARELGLAQTSFSNETGLDRSVTLGGAYGSARDVAHLLFHASKAHPELFASAAYPRSTFTSLSGFSHEAANTNEVVDRIPGVVASKTGFTDISGGNLAVISMIGPNIPISIAVLGSSREERFSDILKLVDAAERHFLTASPF